MVNEWNKTMNPKLTVRIFILLAVLLSVVPASAQSLNPPADMFQLPWEQGRAWVAYSGLDNGTKRPTTSPHYYGLGGAIDFAPRVNMVKGEDTSNDWVTAVGAGTVFQVGYCWVKIDHGNGWTSEYWHLGNIQVTQGQKVSRNQRLAIIHNNANEQVCAGNEYPGPHLHFVFRPSVTSTSFAGWNVNFNSFTNITTFSKSGQTVGLLQPLMNIPSLQIVSRGPLVWDIQYSGSVDAYRHERWSLLLTEPTTFHINVTPAGSGLTPVIVLLDSNGIEISRAFGTLTSTQPAGSYFVQIQSEAGTGYYNLIATRDGGQATATPIVTSTPDGSSTPIGSETPSGSETPIVSVTPSGSETPIVSETPSGSETPVPTWTPIPADITSTSETPIMTDTPMTVTPIVTGTPIATETPIPTPSGAYVWTDILQSTLTIGESSLVTVGLYNVPAEGYASTEFTCTYDPVFAEAGNVMVSSLFGPDPVSAMSGPQNGQFVLAVAGGSGNKAMTDGTAFTFMITGLQAGQTAVQCTARVSTGVGGLDPIAYISDTLNVVGITPSPTGVPALSAIVNGQVLASKAVTIQLFDLGNQLVVSQTANPDGTFALPMSGGDYTIVASAPGFLNAQASITLTAGIITTMPTISLLAGDVDGNGVIDEFDALTLGMSYGASTPAAADLNSDGVIDFLDLELLAENYRASGALAW
jgi:hypothetical protein